MKNQKNLYVEEFLMIIETNGIWWGKFETKLR